MTQPLLSEMVVSTSLRNQIHSIMILHLLNFAGGIPFLNPRNPKNAPSLERIPTNSSSSSVRCAAQLAGGGIPVNDAGILHNKVLVSAFVSAATGQLIKPFASTFLYGKKFDFKTCLHSGGFPSTHASSVVAAATCLAIERGFSDSLFGLAVVYAGLMMYDAQGVRREVGNHARLLNTVTTLFSPSSTNDAGVLVHSYSRDSSSDLEMSDPVLSEDHGSFQKMGTSSLLVKSEERRHARSSGNGNGRSLKENIGHTEAEVAAGALLGLVVSLVICPCL